MGASLSTRIRDRLKGLVAFSESGQRLDKTPYYYVLPIAVVYITLLAFPLVYSFVISLQDFTTVTNWEWVGLENYRTVLGSSNFWNAMENTIYFAIGTTVIPIIIGLGLALTLNNKVKGNTAFRSAIFLPYIIPIVVVGLLFGWLFSEFGIINAVLGHLGLIDSRIAWLSDGRYAMGAVITMATWRAVGFTMVIFLAGLQSIPEEYYEAAKVQGKSDLAIFRHITLPLLKGPMVIATVLGLLAAVQGFAEIWVMTDGGPGRATETIGVYFYQVSFVAGEFGQGAAIGFIMLIVGVVLSMIMLRVND